MGMAARVFYLIKTYLLTVVVFIVAKLAFMLLCHHGHDCSVGDIWDVITHGLTLDLSTSLYFLIFPFYLS